MKVPWLIRKCPARHVPVLEKLICVVGTLGLFAFYLGGIAAIMLGPLLFAASRPDAPISQPVFWLREHTGKDFFLLIYGFIQLTTTAVLFCGLQLMDYLRIRELMAKESIQKEN